MIKFEVVGISNLHSARERLARTEHAFVEAPGRFVREGESRLTRALEEEAPVRSGRLRRSVGAETRTTRDGFETTFHAVGYSRFVIEGTSRMRANDFRKRALRRTQTGLHGAARKEERTILEAGG